MESDATQPNPMHAAVVEALALNEEELLIAVMQFSLQVLRPALAHKVPDASARQNLPLGGLDRWIAKPIGETVGTVIAICLPDGGEALCGKLRYCEHREELKLRAVEAKSLILQKFGLNVLRANKGNILVVLQERLSPEEFKRLTEILDQLGQAMEPIIEVLKNLDVMADAILPWATPITIALFVLLYGLDEICLCDKKDKNWLRI